MKSLQREAEVYEAVRLGLLEILPDGTIWKVAEMRGNRWNGRASLRMVSRRRAEHNQGMYFQVRRMTRGKRVSCLAHRLVWTHFYGPIPPAMQINHINGNKMDNRPENLELATASENIRHAVRVLKVGRTARQAGQMNHAAKLTDAQVEAIRAIYAAGSYTQAAIAKRFGVSHKTVSKVVRGDRRKEQPGPTADYTKNRSRGGGNHRKSVL